MNSLLFLIILFSKYNTIIGGYTFEHRSFDLLFVNSSNKVTAQLDPFSLTIKENIDIICNKITCNDNKDSLVKSAQQIHIQSIYDNVWKDYENFVTSRFVNKNSNLKKSNKNNLNSFNGVTSSWREHLAPGQEHLIKDYNSRDAEINALLIGHVYINPICIYTDNQGIVQPSAHFPHKRCQLARIFYSKNITSSSFAWSTNINPSETDINTLVGFSTELFNTGLWEHSRALAYFILFAYLFAYYSRHIRTLFAPYCDSHQSHLFASGTSHWTTSSRRHRFSRM